MPSSPTAPLQAQARTILSTALAAAPGPEYRHAVSWSPHAPDHGSLATRSSARAHEACVWFPRLAALQSTTEVMVDSARKCSPPPAGRARRWLVRTGLVLGSTIATLLAGEFAARWHMEGSFVEALDSVVDLRTAADAGHDGGLVEDPALGFKLSPRLADVNSRGVRHAELQQPKPQGQFRTFLVGDSVGFPLDGLFHLVEQYFTARSHRDLVFVNACVHGYTTYQERVFLERDLLDLAPDLVILQYCVNDNYRFLHRITSKGRRLLTLEAKNYLFPEGDGAWPSLTRSSYLVYACRKALLRWRTADERVWQGVGRAAWDDATWPSEGTHLRAMADGVRAMGGRFVVVAVPHEDQLDPLVLAERPDFVRKPQRALAEICAAAGIPFLDLHDAFASHRSEALFLDRLHLTARGHELAGERLIAFLSEHHLVPVD